MSLIFIVVLKTMERLTPKDVAAVKGFITNAFNVILYFDYPLGKKVKVKKG
jgi:hypothetical protein